MLSVRAILSCFYEQTCQTVKEGLRVSKLFAKEIEKAFRSCYGIEEFSLNYFKLIFLLVSSFTSDTFPIS